MKHICLFAILGEIFCKEEIEACKIILYVFFSLQIFQDYHIPKKIYGRDIQNMFINYMDAPIKTSKNIVFT